MIDNNYFLIDVWESVKPFIPPKERTQCAIALLEVFDDNGQADDIEDEKELDRHMRDAVKHHFSGDVDELDMEDGE